MRDDAFAGKIYIKQPYAAKVILCMYNARKVPHKLLLSHVSRHTSNDLQLLLYNMDTKLSE